MKQENRPGGFPHRWCCRHVSRQGIASRCIPIFVNPDRAAKVVHGCSKPLSETQSVKTSGLLSWCPVIVSWAGLRSPLTFQPSFRLVPTLLRGQNKILRSCSACHVKHRPRRPEWVRSPWTDLSQPSRPDSFKLWTRTPVLLRQTEQIAAPTMAPLGHTQRCSGA